MVFFILCFYNSTDSLKNRGSGNDKIDKSKDDSGQSAKVSW